MDFFDNLFQQLTRVIQFRVRQRPRGRLTATARHIGTRTEITLGAESFFIDCPDPDFGMPEAFDFVVPALAAISASRNTEIVFDQPVSQSMAAKVGMLQFATHVYCLSSISEPRLVLTRVVPDPPTALTGQKIVCMSGGVDSTFAAINAVQGHGYTHGLLIAGADYPHIGHPGFIELRGRVERIAERLGLKLIVLETDIRRLGIEWEMTHGMLLAAALHRMSGSFEEGAIGLDSGLAADFIMHPWGSSAALFALLETASFPLRSFSPTEWRTQKVKRIVDFDIGLLQDLSVCWKDISTGGNCGTCFKCLRTRVALDALGVDGSSLFHQAPPLMAFPELMTVPRSFRDLRTSLVIYSETHHFMRDGPERKAVGRMVKKLRRAYVRRLPYR